MICDIQIKLKEKIKKIDYKILKKQIFSIGFKGFSIVLTFGLTKVFISELGIQRYGDYVLLHGYLIIISGLIGTGNGVLYIKENASIIGFNYQILLKLFFAVIINLLVVVFILILTNAYFDFFNPKIIYSVFSYSLSAFLVEFIRSKTSGNIYVFLKDVSRLFILMLLIYLIPSKDNVYIINVSSAIVLFITLTYLIILFFKYGIEKSQTNHSFKDLYLSGGIISLGISTEFLKNRLDIFLIDLFFDKKSVVIYDILMKLGQLINLPKVALKADLAKQFAKSIKLNTYSKDLKKRIKTTKYLGYLFSVFCILIIPFYLKFYGYDLNIFNLSIAIILTLVTAISCYFGPIGLFAQLSSVKKYFLKIRMLAILISTLITCLLVAYLDIFSMAISNIITLIGSNYLIHRKIKETYNFKV